MDAYMGEIHIWPGPKCPTNWHWCDGTLLKIEDYQALYSVIGVTYGGDGVTNFALPDLRGRLPMHYGQGPNLSMRVPAQVLGATIVSLSASEMAMHDHPFMASSETANSTSPENAVLGTSTAVFPYLNEAAAGTKAVMDSGMLQTNPGGGEAHPNMMPTIAFNFIICLVGNYPVRPN